jgi:hypothetical protein
LSLGILDALAQAEELGGDVVAGSAALTRSSTTRQTSWSNWFSFQMP